MFLLSSSLMPGAFQNSLVSSGYISQTTSQSAFFSASMFFLELGPIATPFIPKANKPLTDPVYMRSHKSAHEYLRSILGRYWKPKSFSFLAASPYIVLRNDAMNFGVLDQ